MSPVAEFDTHLRDWLADATGSTGATIDTDAPLFENGLLDSPQFVELILLVEELLGRPLGPDELVPENFATLGTIVRAFQNLRGAS